MVENGDTLLGNEWINYGQEYYKIKIGQDGIYRFTSQQLGAEGIPVAQIDPATLRLYWMGREQQLFVSTLESTLGDTDFIEFYAQKNRSELDRFLFQNPDETMLNPGYGLTADSSSYYLTWTPGESSSIRYESIVTDLGGVIPQKRTWYSHKEHLELNTHHHKGKINNQGVRFSHYVEGEGFGSKADAKHSVDIEVKSLASEGPRPTLHFRMTGNLVRHEVNLAWNSISKMDLQFEGTNNHGGSVLIKDQFAIDRTELTAENTFEASTSGPTDKVTFGQIYLEYPRHLDFDGKDIGTVTFEDARDGMYLELSNFNHGNIAPIVFDLNGGNRITSVVENDLVKIIVPSGPSNRRLVIVNPQSQIKSDQKIERIAFDPLHQSDAQFIMISHRALLQAGNGGGNHVEAYAQYRQSEAGGSYRTQIIDISQLEDQFAYGVDLHPLSVKNFLNYISEQWSDPQFIFLIGKGLEYAEGRHQDFEYNYLPVFGIPGSDNLLTSKMESSVPLVPVGRLAARTPEHIAIYLDKIRTMEDLIANAPQTIEDRAWMKRVLHLGGGVGNGEVNLLTTKLNEMKEIIESSSYGGDVTTWTIQSQDIIDQNNNRSVIDLINSGLIVKTYFGHGSIFTTQFNGFEDPQFLSNKERYSVMLSLGCHTGNLFVPDFSLGEANIFAKDKGAVCYLATSGLGFLTALDAFGKRWYALICDEAVNDKIGTINKKVITEHDLIPTANVKTLMQQLILHGDPSFGISSAAGPDYMIDFSSVSFDPDFIQTSSDSFEVNFDLYNLGIKNKDSLLVEFIHELANGDQVPLLRNRITSTVYIRNIAQKLPVIRTHDLSGVNSLIIRINNDNNVIEYPDPAAYLNNKLWDNQGKEGIRIPFVQNGVVTLYPIQFGIVSQEQVELIAHTSDPLASERAYIIQLDTTEEFNSSLKVENRVNQKGGLIKWAPSIALLPNTVYYWRISEVVQDQSQTIWSSSSFSFLPGSPDGWCQQHYFQFLKDKPAGISLRQNRMFEYKKNSNEIRIFNVRNNENRITEFFYDGQQFRSPLGSPLKAGISLIIVNPINQKWFINEGGSHGSVLIPGEANLYAYDVANLDSRKDMISFIDEVIPDGFYVFLYTHLKDTLTSFYPESWAGDSTVYGDNLFKCLERHGAKKVRQLESRGTVPYNFFFQKGVTSLAEDVAENKYSSILTSANAEYLNTSGKFRSTQIGPAGKWKILSWSIDPSDNPAEDISSISLYGHRSSSDTGTLLLENLNGPSIQLGEIESNTYPFLSLSFETSDEQNRTTPGLRNWKIFYDGLPDIAINPELSYEFMEDTSQIGDEVKIKVGVENVSIFDMDSILVLFTISNSQNQVENIFQRYPPLAAGDKMTLEQTFDTENFIDGPHLMTMVANPNDDQPETYLGNNILLQRFLMFKDRIQPILDVTFDGIRIMNADIVSPKPVIEIQLKDENKSVLIKDSSLFEIFIKPPSGDLEKIELSDPNIEFTPATDLQNKAILKIFRHFEIDGLYELHVQGTDASGNVSSRDLYQIQFNVINSNSVARVLPYPNPFSESTRFLYTITGNLPTTFKIQIMTTSGNVVREIDLAREDQLKIGTHLSEISWDGTDQFNDRLGAGIYLYQVTIKDDLNQEYESFSTPADRFFENDLGKIVIVR